MSTMILDLDLDLLIWWIKEHMVSHTLHIVAYA